MRRPDTGDYVRAPRDRQRVPVAGGVLVYESRELGRELVGFENVQDWDDVADQVTADLRVKTPEHTPLSEHEPHATLQATDNDCCDYFRDHVT